MSLHAASNHARKYLLLVLALLSACQQLGPAVPARDTLRTTTPEQRLLRESRYVMGTLLTITLCGGAERRPELERSFAIAQELESKLSTYQSESELSLLNRDGRLAETSPDLREFLLQAKRLSLATRASFDISVGALLKLWERAALRNQLPSLEELAEARRKVDSRAILLSSATGAHILEPQNSVALSIPGMILDSGGLGKGFAVDKIVDYLKAQQISCALVDFGHSSSYALGAAPGDSHWRLQMQFPGMESLGYLELRDQALSASHSFGRPLEIQGQRYGRIIDPSTGKALHSSKAAIVLSSSASEAEALSKALLLLDSAKDLQQKMLQPFEYWRYSEGGSIRASVNFPLVSEPSASVQTQITAPQAR